MKKKIIIGSIIAVALIVLLSFTNVVGHQNVKFDARVLSPLFHVRSKQKTNLVQNNYFSNHVGIENYESIYFPNRDNDTILFQKILNKIINMDDETFNNFINTIEKSNMIDKEDIQTLSDECEKIRKNYDIDYKSSIQSFPNGQFPTMGEWFLGCYLIILCAIIFEHMIVLLLVLLIIFTGYSSNCPL